MISANAIDITNMPSDLLEVLGPLFCEMEDLCQALDMEEFVDAVGRLYDTLSMPDKDKLLLRERKRKQVQEHDFVVSTQQPNFVQPKINEKSKQLAARKHQTEVDVAMRLYGQRKIERNPSDRDLQNNQYFASQLQDYNQQ